MILRYIVLFSVGFSIAMIMAWAGKRASESQKWLLLTASSVTISELLYFLEISFVNLEFMLMVHNLLYMFKAVTLLCFALFIFKYCEIKVKGLILQIAFGISMLLMLILTLNESHGLAYEVIGIGEDFVVPYLILEPKILYYIFIYAMCAFMVYCGALIIKHVSKSTGVQRKRYKILAAIVLLPTTGLFMQAILGWTRVDYVVADLSIGMWLLFILTKKYGLLDTLQVAKESIMDLSAEGLLVVDADYNVLYANDAIAEKFPSILKMQEDSDRTKLKKIFSQPEMVYREDGVYGEIRVSKLCEGELLLGYMAWVLDMSFVNEYTNQILHLKDAAERVNREKMAFLAQLAEEMQAPMEKVLDSSELILQQVGNPETTQEYALELRDAGRKMEHIVNEAIGHFKTESGKREQHIETYYTQALLEDVNQAVYSQAKEKGLEYKIEIDETIPYRMRGAVYNVKKTLTNVMSHVVRCSDEGTISLKICCKWRTQKLLQLEAVACYGVCRKERKELETDLGIALMRRLVEQFNGQIQIEIMEDETLRIIFCMEQEIVDNRPIGDMSLRFQKPDEQEFMQSFLTTARVLIVDDCEKDIARMKEHLQMYGALADVAESGAVALDMIQTQSYDMVFVEHMIKDMGGMETMLRIRELDKGKYQQLPVIVLAENKAAEVMEEIVMLGFDGYLVKPVDARKLAKIMLDKLPKTKISYIDAAYIKGVKEVREG